MAAKIKSGDLVIGHGLRPMKKDMEESAYVRAQRRFFHVFFRTAHCQRERYFF